MSKEAWIEIEEKLFEKLGRKPTSKEIEAEIGNEIDAVYERLRE